MNRHFRKISYFTLLAALCSSVAHAEESSLPTVRFSGILDLRAVHGSDAINWQDGGQGKTRYGSKVSGGGRSGLELAEAGLIMAVDFSWDLTAMVHVQAHPDQKSEVDLVEGFLHYKPLSLSDYSFEAKAGLFYPPISLEHIDVGWTSPYTLTPSAINAWVGEEVKSLNLQMTGHYRTADWQWSLTGALFTHNDPTGTWMAWRGWAMHDRKATWHDTFPLPYAESLDTGIFSSQTLWNKPHLEIDDRIGVYLQAKGVYQEWLTLTAMYYNNNGDPVGFKEHDQDEVFALRPQPPIQEGAGYALGVKPLAHHAFTDINYRGDYSWATEFQALGAYALLPYDMEYLGQFMTGTTKMGVVLYGGNLLDVRFTSAYSMLVKTIDAFQISGRVDWFKVKDRSYEVDDNNEDGYALTIAGAYHIDDHQRLMVEALYIDSDRANRVDLDLATKEKESQLQLSYRFVF